MEIDNDVLHSLYTLTHGSEIYIHANGCVFEKLIEFRVIGVGGSEVFVSRELHMRTECARTGPFFRFTGPCLESGVFRLPEGVRERRSIVKCKG